MKQQQAIALLVLAQMVAVECLKPVQGLGATTIYCGDGINDIAALAAADVGMAIGATDAVVAASLSTARKSVAGNTAQLICCPCEFYARHPASLMTSAEWPLWLSPQWSSMSPPITSKFPHQISYVS